MAGILGMDTGLNVPKVEIGGFLSNTWVYVFIVLIIGFILIIGALISFFFLTYKKKVIIFENISGLGYQPVMRTRARVVKVGNNSGELLKTFKGGAFLSADGKKMGKNTYWFAKGEDGYLYNIVLGDLDSKRAMLDIEPVDRDVRMYHQALDRLSNATYNKPGFMERYGTQMILFFYLVIFILGMWFVIGQLKDVTGPLAAAQESSAKLQETTNIAIMRLDSLVRALGYVPQNSTVTGLVPAGAGG